MRGGKQKTGKYSINVDTLKVKGPTYEKLKS